MTVLKKLAFQNGIREAFIISAIITVISLISSLFIGKKQSKLIPKKGKLSRQNRDLFKIYKTV